MRAGGAALLWAFIAAASPAMAQSCGEAPAGPKSLYDRNWIRSNAVFYGADAQGLFKLSLGSNTVQRIGDRQAQAPSHLHVSPMKRWVLYERGAASSHGLYDIAGGAEHELDVRSSGPVQLQFA